MTRDDQIKEAAIRRYGNNGNESQYMLGKIQAFMVGARYADKNPNGSQIKWQKGEPKEDGRYLVTTIYGHVATAVIVKDDLHYKQVFKEYVKAWCSLNDIEPYKEKEEQP